MNQNIMSFFLLVLIFIQFRQEANAQEQIHLFPDKSYAVSGDTIWFSILIYNENQDETSQVVHIQLDDLKNNHILKVSVLCHGAFGEGYIRVPDSLSTGVYALVPFTLVQRNSNSAKVNQKLINIYNRFDENINTIGMPGEGLQQYPRETGITIHTDRENYKIREEVSVTFDLQQDKLNDFQHVWITAGVSDPISEPYITSFVSQRTSTNMKTPVLLVEKNGILITGKVTKTEFDNIPASDVIVLLSIPDSIPFFDYCVSDENGMFYFYLRNAVGKADLVLQTTSNYNLDYKVKLLDNYLEVQNIEFDERPITYDEGIFTNNILKASYFNKLFNGYSITGSDYFSKPQQFNYPFYGEPTKTYDPNLFIDLPDFQEISREILNGVQYRERKNEITIRLMDLGSNSIFNDEPLRLLDGIPVFDNYIFKPMSTEDIRKVDVVYYERFYGDLSFQGILSVYTKKRSLSWLDNDPGIEHIKFTCLQQPQKYNFRNTAKSDENSPNFNKVLYRSSIKNLQINNKFNFFTSDIKGDITIRMIFVDKNNRITYSNKIVKVE